MPIGIPTICWYTMSPNCTYIFSMRKVKASLNSVQVQHLYESYVLLEKNPALSEVQRYVFDSLLKHHLTRDNTFMNKLCDKWERFPYVVIEKPNLELPVFKVQQEGNKGPIRTLHRHLLLPIMSIDDSQSRSVELESRRSRLTNRSKSMAKEIGQGQSSRSGSDNDSSEESYIYIRPVYSAYEQVKHIQTSSFDEDIKFGISNISHSELSHAHYRVCDLDNSTNSCETQYSVDSQQFPDSSPAGSSRPKRSRKPPYKLRDWVYAMKAGPDENGIVYV